jgi:hypothetical protein
MTMEREPSAASLQQCSRHQFDPERGADNEKKNGASFDAPFFQAGVSPNQVQVITPPVIAQVFADCVWVAVASHEGGGPAVAVTVTVTFCEGVKP